VDPFLGRGGIVQGSIPFYNPAQVNLDAANDAINNSTAAAANGNPGEAARQMDLYYYYSGFTFGSAYAGIIFPPPPLSPGSAPTITPISIPPLEPIEP